LLSLNGTSFTPQCEAKTRWARNLGASPPFLNSSLAIAITHLNLLLAVAMLMGAYDHPVAPLYAAAEHTVTAPVCPSRIVQPFVQSIYPPKPWFCLEFTPPGTFQTASPVHPHVMRKMEGYGGD
jgi:hypothetical protein